MSESDKNKISQEVGTSEEIDSEEDTLKNRRPQKTEDGS